MKESKLGAAVRLILSTSMGNREIGRELGIAYNTVRRYRGIIREQQLTMANIVELSPSELESKFNRRGGKSSSKRMPDWPHVHRELDNKGVTRSLLWFEYKEEDPETAYELSRFNELYVEWAGKNALSMRQQYEPGERGFTDFSGTKMHWVDPASGERHDAEIFVATAGVAGLLYAQGTPSQQKEHWVEAHCNWYAFLGGVPKITIPDNLKSAVQKAGREPVINPSYLDMASHYGTIILPARARRPKDKALVEGGVLIFLRWVIARLRKRVFHSLQELNAAISECVDIINNRTMRTYKQSRRERFEAIDRPALLPLRERYEFGEWVGPLRVPPDYHVSVKGHFYSVPYRFVQQDIHARLTASVVELFCDNVRVACHVRSNVIGGKTTDRSHMPEHHLAWADHTPERYIHWASGIGTNVLAVVEQVIAEAKHVSVALNTCSSLQALGRKYPADRFDRACARAIHIKSFSVKSIRSILQCGLDRSEKGEERAGAIPTHNNVRGANYYHSETSHVE